MKYSDPSEAGPSDSIRWRQSLKIIFAAAVLWAAATSVASAQVNRPAQESLPASHDRAAGVSIQYDGTTVVPQTPVAADDGDRKTLTGDRRPASVELFAKLSNFDSDSDPDGWRAELVIRDQIDRPVQVAATATFEIVPRISLADGREQADESATPVTWSVPVEFDQDQVARISLPLRRSLQAKLGWTASLYPSRSDRSRDIRDQPRIFGRNQPFATVDSRTLVGAPRHGELRVRVFIPGHGVFHAVTPVRLRPPVLVDTQWPYR